MRHFIKTFLYSIVGLCVGSCVQDIETFGKNNRSLVIAGEINNEEGPYYAKVYFTTGFGVRSEYENRAIVQLVDDLGHIETMRYRKYGTFVSSDEFRGEVGRWYHIKVTMPDDEVYESAPQLLTAPPPLDNLEWEPGNGAINFYVDFTDPVETKNYYRWRYKGTYKVFAPLAPPDVDYCWLENFDVEFLKVERDLLFNGKTMIHYPVSAIKFDRKLEYGYSLNVRLQSISEVAYHYWNSLENQIDNTGTIFETANFQVRGNISRVGDPEESVLGFFQVSGVESRRIFIGDYMGLFGPISCEGIPTPSRCLSCLNFSANATTRVPDFWPGGD